jgi:transposase InsO family protein
MIMRMVMDHVSIRTASSASSTCGGPCRHRNSRRPLQSHSPRRRNHRAVTPRRFRACTTDSHHDLPVAPNRLSQNFAASRPNQIWLADITYVPTAEGWL